MPGGPWPSGLEPAGTRRSGWRRHCYPTPIRGGRARAPPRHPHGDPASVRIRRHPVHRREWRRAWRAASEAANAAARLIATETEERQPGRCHPGGDGSRGHRIQQRDAPRIRMRGEVARRRFSARNVGRIRAGIAFAGAFAKALVSAAPILWGDAVSPTGQTGQSEGALGLDLRPRSKRIVRRDNLTGGRAISSQLPTGSARARNRWSGRERGNSRCRGPDR